MKYGRGVVCGNWVGYGLKVLLVIIYVWYVIICVEYGDNLWYIIMRGRFGELSYVEV